VAAALLTTKFHGLLKLIGAAVSIIAFLFLLIGLILLLSYLKRETRSISDIYPHTHSRIANHVSQRQTVLHKAVRREVHETYRAYSLSPGQHPYNQTHFQQYSEQARDWLYVPYSSLSYEPRSQSGAQAVTTERPLRNVYGPLAHYDDVYANTRACIGWSAVLSIIALILALLLALVLAFSWLTAKKLGPETKTVTTTTVKTEYVPLPQDITQEQVVLRDVVISDQPATTQRA